MVVKERFSCVAAIDSINPREKSRDTVVWWIGMRSACVCGSAPQMPVSVCGRGHCVEGMGSWLRSRRLTSSNPARFDGVCVCTGTQHRKAALWFTHSLRLNPQLLRLQITRTMHAYALNNHTHACQPFGEPFLTLLTHMNSVTRTVTHR